MHEDPENIKADCVGEVVFNLHQIKRRAFGTPGTKTTSVTLSLKYMDILIACRPFHCNV